jgi:adenine-specific DNA-methyltransferase
MKTKLELTWIDKDKQPRLEPRILLEDPELSYSAKKKGTDNDIFDNMLIHGDNLLALKALEQDFTGEVKCVFIDPPYNTGSAFAQYDDGVEHSIWLSLMRDRLTILKTLMRPDGSIWVSMDDNEVHYLKVLMDELFGRANFVGNIIWEKRTTRENRRVFSFNHDHILVYAKEFALFRAQRNPLPLSKEVLSRYKNPDDDPRGPWQSVSVNAQAGHATASQFYELTAPNGKKHSHPKGRCWLYTQQRMQEEIEAGNIWFGATGNNVPRAKKFLESQKGKGLTPETIWTAEDASTNDKAKKHLKQIFPDGVRFDTPKPEALVERVLHIATNVGDLVLDSFLGSGTTAAVAQKMRRRWIGIELGEHALECCVPRMKKVVDGVESGGISNAVDWEGGGGFRFYTLTPPSAKKTSEATGSSTASALTQL